MQYFLQPVPADNRKPPVIEDISYIGEATMEEKPLYPEEIKIHMINNRGTENTTYHKPKLIKILKSIFGINSVPGGKKSDLVRFLLEPGNLDKIEHNNIVYMRTKKLVQDK